MRHGDHGEHHGSAKILYDDTRGSGEIMAPVAYKKISEALRVNILSCSTKSEACAAHRE